MASYLLACVIALGIGAVVRVGKSHHEPVTYVAPDVSAPASVDPVNK